MALLFGAMLMFAVVLGLFWLAEGTLGIPQADDPGYQSVVGRTVADVLAASPDGSRAYILWYKLLALIDSGTSGLTALNAVLLGTALAVLVFLHVSQASGSWWTGLAIGSVVACSYLNLGGWPKVSHFALAIVLLGLVLGGRMERPAAQFGILAAALLAGSMARPELLIGFAMALALCVAWPVLERRDRKFGLMVAAALLAAAGLTHILIGLPMTSSGVRTGVALSQHFALNWVGWEGSPRDPWLEHEAIWRDVFGGARGLLEAWEAHPSAMARHLGENLVRTLAMPVAAAFAPAAAPIEVAPVLLWRPWLAAGYILGAAFLVVSIAAYWSRALLQERGRTILCEALKLSCVVLPAMLSSILIYPRYHYMLGIALPLLMMGGLGIGLRWGGRRWFGPASAICILALVGVSVALAA
ncbi:hypothetical protein [Arenibaculum pallidiluteum]|uniref:hypothetical protein n=1 Tax=Arenibaculum pallidiluteum TaxID=2812559 RepID=UPI001A956EFE|nr:hypothetical protein [Arenibaculum pallidiluteum]